ncbi:glycosyltransferase family 2 protein [Candidatus Uhrbacteria bacterium]|nr:glycosyltransferase family 2 protein [Candidatus Uhrbacteria bacterium]
MNTTVSVVIPCHNEAESIQNVIKAVPKEVFEIVVVDNNSTDATAERARECGVRVVTEHRIGYGRALKTGFDAAQGTVIATLDGDGQYPSDAIMRLVGMLEDEQLDFLSASRFPLSNKRSMPKIRQVGNLFLTFLTNVLFNLSILDSQSGMWAFRRSVLDSIHLESDGMSLSEEIKIRSFLHPSVRCGESYISYEARSGKSKLSVMRDGYKNAMYLFSLRQTLPINHKKCGTS